MEQDAGTKKRRDKLSLGDYNRVEYVSSTTLICTGSNAGV